jgi:hypothetical protein
MLAIANVLYSAEKKEAAYYYFEWGVWFSTSLVDQAPSEHDRANVYAYASIQKWMENFGIFREIYARDPKSRIFSFLLLREIVK